MSTNPSEIMQSAAEVVDKDSTSSGAKEFAKENYDPQKAEQFQTALEKTQATQTQGANGLMDLAAQKNQVSTASHTLEDIQNTSASIKTRIEEIKEVLGASDVRVKDSYKGLLDNKLSHIDDALRIALEKIGSEQTIEAGGLSFSAGVEKFLGFLTRGQHRLNAVVDEIDQIRFNKKQSVNPADLLAVQVKVNFVQQELELFTNLLNKGLESTKTLLNTQI